MSARDSVSITLQALDQSQGKLAGSHPSGGIGMPNVRGEFTGPTMSELLVDPAALPIMTVNTCQPVDHGVG